MGKRRRYRNRGKRKAEKRRRGPVVCYFYGDPVYAGDLLDRAMWTPTAIRMVANPGEPCSFKIEMEPAR